MSGWLVQVPVKWSGGSGRPIANLYAAWLPDAVDALDAVLRHMSDYAEKPKTVAPLPDAACSVWALNRGRCAGSRPTPDRRGLQG